LGVVYDIFELNYLVANRVWGGIDRYVKASILRSASVEVLLKAITILLSNSLVLKINLCYSLLGQLGD